MNIGYININEVKVSVIINNYNYGRFLADAINSALNQTFKNAEIIVVDDGSTDNSIEVINSFSARIKPILKRNGGQASALNAGMKESSGDIVIFLDSDDMLLPSTIENVVKAFSKPEVVKVHWPLWRVDVNAEKTGGVVPHFALAEGNLKDKVVGYGPNAKGGPFYSSPTSGNAWRRDFLEKTFPLSEEEYRAGGNDFHLSVLAAVYGEFKALSEPQGLYRVHGSNDTMKPIDKYIAGFFPWFEHTSNTLLKKLKDIGVNVNVANWRRDTWYHKLDASIIELAAIVPSNSAFILVDENSLGTVNLMSERKGISLVEKDGQYYGNPADDASAINELEKHRANGVAFLIFLWPAFWYFTFYQKFHSYLRTNFKCTVENDRVVVFDLGMNPGLDKVVKVMTVEHGS